MKKTLLQIALSLSVISLFVGCSLDRAQIISQPPTAKPGDTISVLFTDIYMILSDKKTIGQAYTRDSLHAAYGLPSGWKVLSSDYYVASGIQMNKLLNVMTDSNAVATMLKDSLATFTARKVPMTNDIGWSSYFSGNTFSAHNAGMDSIKVAPAMVGQWLAYSSKINLSYAKGTVTDTGFAVKSLPFDSGMVATAASLYDSVYVKTVPIICFARLIVPPGEKIDTLYYFTKTGPKPTTAISLFPNYDKGDMTYAPITVNANAISVKVPPSFTQDNQLWTVSSGSARSLNGIYFSVHANAWQLRLFDLSGKSLGRVSSGYEGVSSSTVRFETAAPLTEGTYIVKLESQSGNSSKIIRIVK